MCESNPLFCPATFKTAVPWLSATERSAISKVLLSCIMRIDTRGAEIKVGYMTPTLLQIAETGATNGVSAHHVFQFSAYVAKDHPVLAAIALIFWSPPILLLVSLLRRPEKKEDAGAKVSRRFEQTILLAILAYGAGAIVSAICSSAAAILPPGNLQTAGWVLGHLSWILAWAVIFTLVIRHLFSRG